MDAQMRASVVGLLCWFLAIASLHFSSCNGNSNASGIAKERKALLRFKDNLTDPSSLLSSWASNDDCCSWDGVVCDNFSDHVLELHLQGSCTDDNCKILSGKIKPSLLNLRHLSYLNLCYNDFGGIKIRNFVRSLRSLRYLDLCEAGFSGPIPQTLGNLSSLHYLCIPHCSNSLVSVEKLQWISGPLVLQHLDLSCVNLSQAYDWLQVTSMLSSLEELHLLNCQLRPSSSFLGLNFSSLLVLDLSFNYFNPLMPNWLFGLTGLDSLVLRYCDFSGPISSGLQYMTSLRDLNLSWNHFDSTIPTWLYNFKGLKSLKLGGNDSQSLISDTIPACLEFSSRIDYLDLSNNQIDGEIPYIPKHNNFSYFGSVTYLTSNRFSGPLPTISPHLHELDLSNNSFSGDMSHFLCGSSNETNQLRILNLRENNLSGKIPDCWVNWHSIEYINLGNNNLEGSIPSSIKFLGYLKSLEVRSNSLSGEFPLSLRSCTNLLTVDLGVNKFVGSILACIGRSLIDLKFLGLRSIKFTGIQDDVILVTKGSEYQYNTILALVTNLDLSSYNFSREIPEELTSLLGLRSINLSRSHLTGMIPKKIVVSVARDDTNDVVLEYKKAL
ncbi:receptor-like protein EIX1 [Camellia sinensis]|uniref:receptor-like protein EIX1 n=1 Tax=Camellia sinensis TaxID=4442 RepID=UPI00103627F2|nr:receptor-like protein EIX1 [Camellia sinensis]